MYLRNQPRINYAAMNNSGYIAPTAIMASKLRQEQLDITRSNPTTPLTSKPSIDAKQAEIEALKAELCVLDMEEDLAKLRLDVLNKRNAVKELQNPGYRVPFAH